MKAKFILYFLLSTKEVSWNVTTKKTHTTRTFPTFLGTHTQMNTSTRKSRVRVSKFFAKQPDSKIVRDWELLPW